jgi:chemotaxis signal transduction protein
MCWVSSTCAARSSRSSTCAYTAITVIIVVSVNSAAGRRDFGVVVDGVSDVVDVNSAEVKPAPELGSRSATDFIRGLVPGSERMVVLLDIDRLISSDLAAVAGNAPDDALAASAA